MNNLTFAHFCCDAFSILIGFFHSVHLKICQSKNVIPTQVFQTNANGAFRLNSAFQIMLLIFQKYLLIRLYTFITCNCWRPFIPTFKSLRFNCSLPKGTDDAQSFLGHVFFDQTLFSHNNGIDLSFINTKKAFKKLYMFYCETFRIVLNPSSVKKNKATLGNVSNSKP